MFIQTERHDDQYPSVYISDLKSHEPGSKITITGQYLSRRDYKDWIVITVRDITGLTYASVKTSSDEQKKQIRSIDKFSRIRIFGRVGLNKNGNLVIKEVDIIKNLGSLKIPYQDLEPEMREYASRMFVSRIANTCTSLLREHGFDEFDSKVISSEWIDGGLEPLQVVYPGFGNPVTLITSPSAQVMDFLNATGTDKAFTVALSFTSTFRHPGNSSETRVIVAKAIDLTLTDLKQLASTLCMYILDTLNVVHPVLKEVSEVPWPDKPPQDNQQDIITIALYSSDVITSGTSWHNMLLENVIHIISNSGIILVDGSIEKIGKRNISTLAIYPARFLSLIDTPLPRRQLSDLTEYKSWHT